MAAPTFKDVSVAELSAFPSVDFLLLTAVPVELRALWDHFEGFADGRPPVRVQWGASTYYIGVLGKYVCAGTMCEAGSVGRAGSLVTAVDAIERLRPRGAIMVGIAFGKGPPLAPKQEIGHVLVATQVIQYEIQRVEDGREIFRGSRPEPGGVLKNRLRDVSLLNPPIELKDKVHLGPLLSGEKLVDSADFKARLLVAFPDAVGGEMEGAGLYSAADSRKIEWAIVKAISDLGVDKKDEYQELAARNAALLAAALLRNSDLSPHHFGGGVKPEVEGVATIAKNMAMEEATRRIRDANKERQHRSDQFEQAARPVVATGAKPTPEQATELTRLKLRRDQAVEDWLNAYDDGCAKFLKGVLDRDHFRRTFGEEVCELFTIEGPHRKRLFPRETSKYPSLWAVFEEWNPNGPKEPARAAAPLEPECSDTTAKADFDAAREAVVSANLPRREAAYERVKAHTRCHHRADTITFLLGVWRRADPPITDEDRLIILRHLSHAAAWGCADELMTYWMNTPDAAADPRSGLQAYFHEFLRVQPEVGLPMVLASLRKLAGDSPPQFPTNTLLHLVSQVAARAPNLTDALWTSVRETVSLFLPVAVQFPVVSSVMAVFGKKAS